MKKLMMVVVFMCMVMAGEAFAQTQQLVMEFHGTNDVGWKHREGVVANPLGDAFVQVRKGIGGPDAALLLGWKFQLGSFVLSPFIGANVNDKVQLVSVRSEVWYAYKCSWMVVSGISSPNFAVDDTRQNDWYQLAQAMFPLNKELSLGIKSDGYYLLEDKKLVFLQVGPRAGMLKAREDGEAIWVGVWSGWEKELDTPFFRLEAAWYF